MITVSLCLVFNAHPDAWLSDADFVERNALLTRLQESALSKIKKVLVSYERFSEITKTGFPADIELARRDIVETQKLFDLYQKNFESERAAMRRRCITTPRSYDSIRRP